MRNLGTCSDEILRIRNEAIKVYVDRVVAFETPS
jgi:hypothetical protein